MKHFLPILLLLIASVARAQSPQPAWWNFAPTGAVDGQGIYRDVVSRLDAQGRQTMYDADPVGYVHEGSHWLHSMIRNRAGGTGKVNACYVGGGKCVVFAEPKLSLATVRQYIPQGQDHGELASAHGSWGNEPLYVLDEWTCYCNGTQAAQETKADAARLRGSMERAQRFAVYADALVTAISRHDPNYPDIAALRQFVEWQKLRVQTLAGGRNVVARKPPSANFVVAGTTPELAAEIRDAAERLRREMSVLWLGEELPSWSGPCQINVRITNGGSGGATVFTFDRGQVYGWRMSVEGSRERILDSVLPHEISHTVFASYFGKQLPRWVDEGGCCAIEHQSEQAKYEQRAVYCLKNQRGIAFEEMFAAKEYPADAQAFYAQAHSVAQWMIEKYGHQHFVHAIGDGMQSGNWPQAFGYSTAKEMQDDWLSWVKAGRPKVHTVAYQGCVRCQVLPRARAVVQNVIGTRPTIQTNVVVRPNPGSGLTPPPTNPPPSVNPPGLPPPTQPPPTQTQPPGNVCDCAELKQTITNLQTEVNILKNSNTSIGDTINNIDNRVTNIEKTDLSLNYDTIAEEVRKRQQPFNIRLARPSKNIYTPYVTVYPDRDKQYVTIDLDLVDLAK